MNDISPLIPVVFPPNPAIGEIFDAPNGARYRWDGVVWMAAPVTGGGGPEVDPLAVHKTGGVDGIMSGFLTLNDDPVDPLYAATKRYIDNLPGGTDAPSDGTTYGRIDGAWERVVNLAGDNVEGALRWNAPPGDDAIVVNQGFIRAINGRIIADPGIIAAHDYTCFTELPGPMPGNGYAFGRNGEDGAFYKGVVGNGGGVLLRQSQDNVRPRIEDNAGANRWTIVDQRGGQIDGDLNVHKAGIAGGVAPSVRWYDDAGNIAWIYGQRSTVDGNPGLIFRVEGAAGADTMARSRFADPPRLQLLGEPEEPEDAATKNYVDAAIAAIPPGGGVAEPTTADPYLRRGGATPDWVPGVPQSGGSFTGDLTIDRSAVFNSPHFTLNSTGPRDEILFQEGGNTRWTLGKAGNGEPNNADVRSFWIARDQIGTPPAAGSISFQISYTTGRCLVGEDPQEPLGIATKRYVDGLREWFNHSAAIVIVGNEAIGDAKTFTIPAASLPDLDFDWIIHGAGYGTFFFSTKGATGTPSGSWHFEVQTDWDGAGPVWTPFTTVTNFSTVFADLLSRINRPAVITTGPNGPTFRYQRHLRSTDIQYRLVCEVAPTGPCTLLGGLQGQIVSIG